jgi:2-iminobutanoate/2-iminopropanoate deaminase
MSEQSSRPTPLSPARRAGDLVFVSGHIGSRDGRVVSGGIEPQARQAIANLLEALATEDGTAADLVKVTCILLDRADFGAFNEVYRDAFAGIEPLPARTTIIAGMPNPDARVEVEAIARVPRP